MLDEFHNLNQIFQGAAERWYVSPSDYLWRGYAAERFTADDHGRVLAKLRQLRAETERTAFDSREAAPLIGQPTPTSLQEAERLVALSSHLRVAPAIAAHWLDLDPRELREAATAAERTYTRFAECTTAFAGEFPARQPDDFAADTAAQLQARREELQRQCGWSTAWDTELQQLPEALRSFAELPESLDAVRQRAQAVARMLGQPDEDYEPNRLDELAELADIAFRAERRPEREWLVRAGLERAKNVLSQTADDLSTYQAHTQALAERYTPDVLELDAAAMVERFKTQYTGTLSKLSGSYRRDAKAIKAVAVSAKVPPTVTDDLELVAAAQDIAGRLDPQVDRLSQALGSYAAGRETDVSAAQEALTATERILSLSHPDADLGGLGGAVAVGSPSDPAYAQAGEQLRRVTSQLLELLPPLIRFVADDRAAFERTLGELEAGANRVRPAIEQLAALIADLNTGAVTKAAGMAETTQRAAIISELHVLRRVLDERRAAWQRLIGGAFAAERTDWAAVRDGAAWLGRLGNMVDALPQPLREVATTGLSSWRAFDRLAGSCASADSAITAFAHEFDNDRAPELIVEMRVQSFDHAFTLVERLVERVDELRDWTEWRAWRRRVRDAGWGDFLQALIEADVADSDVVPAFAHSFWNRRLEALFDDDPELADDLRGGAFQRWVDDFRTLDRKLVRTGADRLIERRERARTTHVDSPGSEVALLRREARKMRRHLPVRVLLSRMPTLLSELKPCLMMSPLTVSHFLSATHTFDLVVFDEASQVPPQDAINCIYRGKQIIVAGDSRQLPPTPFFQIAELDELSPEDEDQSTTEDMESVLDACESLLPSHALRWHYRSHSEPLIAFSNRFIYDERLVTFPSAQDSGEHLGVGFVHVPDGVYARGTSAANNRREAQVVAQRVMHYILDGTGRSLGVIAFNTAQAAAISEELDLLKIDHPELDVVPQVVPNGVRLMGGRLPIELWGLVEL